MLQNEFGMNHVTLHIYYNPHKLLVYHYDTSARLKAHLRQACTLYVLCLVSSTIPDT